MSLNPKQVSPFQMKIRRLSLTLVFSLCSGCGTFAAEIANGPYCPYQGVLLDIHAMTSWEAIKAMRGFGIPLGLIDLPFSAVMDTFVLLESSERIDPEQCPRSYR
ncbi:YceK/YidQ family lipoprotein [Metapseudomonas otitidis]|uniref:YceK/YidQ family lipoprotein n=1 Tax=Metapseudomonas otitidis TaxID=319939 RepID=UPI0013F61FCA|nr:YceK/YidQ family lipoprotein [Pseudomonas otitidis]